MDSEHWISRLAAAKRFYAAQLGHSDRAGMDELEMDEEVRPEFPCPYCYEDHDVGSLCAHLEEEHPFEPQAAACPVCSEMVTKDMVNHITTQHGYLFKNRRRLRRFIIPGSQALSLLSRDLREAHLQVLLGGGGQRSSDNSSSSSATNISADPLLSSFGLGFPTSDAEQASKSTVSIPDDATTVKEAPAQARKLSIDSSLTSEERELKRKQARVRATFVQDLLLSTLFGD
ncbi:Protein DEHYDRATION-INDUCED 19 [Zea mays]|nr:Protein DEHYDRATION-INDUCED 19 [Zea mays]ACF82365.1 unknown [Zea mays]ACR38400.1 unknown [Zea mays]AQK88431.1 drought-induced 19 [Zea mays]WOK03664.1 Drought-induced 19 [Zea mays]WOK03670.1 drought-induced 19 [Zea mays]